MSVRFHIMQASGALAGETGARLHAILARAAETCAARLDLPELDVTVMQLPRAAIPSLGIGGTCHDAHHVQLWLDIGHPHLAAHADTAVTAILAHELHHCARAKALGETYNQSYGAALVAEGLACCFEEETGAPTPFYATACQGDALQRFQHKARPHLAATRATLPGNWADWMFGRTPDDPEFPYQCGYSAAYALVRPWLHRTGLTASAAAGMDAAAILAGWPG